MGDEISSKAFDEVKAPLRLYFNYVAGVIGLPPVDSPREYLLPFAAQNLYGEAESSLARLTDALYKARKKQGVILTDQEVISSGLWMLIAEYREFSSSILPAHDDRLAAIRRRTIEFILKSKATATLKDLMESAMSQSYQ